MLKYIFLGLIGFILLNQLNHSQARDLVFVACGLTAYFFNRHEPNIYSLLLILVAVRATEIIFWLTIDMPNAYIGYPAIIVVDSVALYLILNRNKFLAKIEFRRTGNITPHKYIYSNADFMLSSIYKFYLLLTILMFGEHLLRHLDDIGLPKDWSNTDLLYIYNAYDYIKRGLNVIEYIAILATASKIMRERYVRA